MHIKLLTSNHGASTFYRMRWPAQALGTSRHCRVTFETDIAEIERISSGAAPVSGVPDVVVIQRPLWRRVTDQVTNLQGRGIAVVVELDDDFLSLPADHPARASFDADTNPSQVVRACNHADLVTAPTQALLERYASHGRMALLPNYLPEAAIARPALRLPTRARRVGWPGVSADHPGDLEVTGGAISQVLRTQAADFLVVGPEENVADRLAVKSAITSTGLLSLSGYFAAIRQLEVGIVPLGQSQFNDAKSALKGLELAAAGVVFVASPTVEYESLASEGVGMIARTPAEWATKVTTLLTTPRLRRTHARRARRIVLDRHDLSRNAWRWKRAWEKARVNANARLSAGT